MLQLTNLSVHTPGHKQRCLLSSVHMAFPHRGCYAVIGPSGCGKSTLLKAIAGLLPTEGGTITWNGRQVSKTGWMPGEFGYVPQFTIAQDYLTVRENLVDTMRLRIRGVTPEQQQKRTDDILDAIGLAHRIDHPVRVLSGGEKRRLSLGMELTSRPDILLCDEVTSGLDPQAEEAVFDVLLDLARGYTRQVILVTHSLRHLSQYAGVAVLHQGRLVYAGAPENLTSFFEVEHPEDIYSALVHETKAPRSKTAVSFTPQTEPATAGDSPPRSPLPPPIRQFATLFGRRWRIFWRDPHHVLLQLALIFIFPALVVLFAHRGLPQVRNLSLRLDTGVVQQLQESIDALHQAYSVGTLVSGIVMFQIILLALMGSNNSAREVIGERSLLEKEKLAGLSVGAVLAAKAGFLSLLVLVQSAWMATFVNFFCRFPGSLGSQILILLLANGAVTMSCLAISSWMRSTAQASLASIYLVGFQLPLSGAVLALPQWVQHVTRPFIASYWGWSGQLETCKAERIYDIVLQVSRTELALYPVCLWALASHIAIGLFLSFGGMRRNTPF